MPMTTRLALSDVRRELSHLKATTKTQLMQFQTVKMIPRISKLPKINGCSVPTWRSSSKRTSNGKENLVAQTPKI